jgi:hypothetical protein
MKKAGEVLLATLMLAGLYYTIPTPNRKNVSSVSANDAANQVVIIADGTDPMPRRRR